jgi:hypothetical protein
MVGPDKDASWNYGEADETEGLNVMLPEYSLNRNETTRSSGWADIGTGRGYDGWDGVGNGWRSCFGL